MGPLGGGLLGASSALGPGGTVSSVQVPGLQKSFAFTKSPWGGGKASGGEVGQALLLPPPSDPSRSPPRTPRLATIRRLQCSRPRSSALDHRRRSTAALGLVAADGWRAHAAVQPHLGSTFPVSAGRVGPCPATVCRAAQGQALRPCRSSTMAFVQILRSLTLAHLRSEPEGEGSRSSGYAWHAPSCMVRVRVRNGRNGRGRHCRRPDCQTRWRDELA